MGSFLLPRPWALALAPLVFAGASVAAPVTPTQSITTGLGSTQWLVSNAGGNPDGAAFSGSCSSVTPGLVIQDAVAATGSGDAYDNAWHIFVNGTLYAAPDPVDLTGTTYTAGPVTVSGLEVSVQYQFFTDRQLVRVLASFRNPGTTAVTANVDVPVNVGSDGSTRLDATSSGDTTLTLADRWVVSSDGGPSDAVNTLVFYGPDSPRVLPTSYTQAVFNCAGIQGVGASFALNIPAGQTQALMFFGGIGDIEGTGNTIAGAITNAALFNDAAAVESLGLLANFGSVSQDQVVNWSFGPGVTIGDASITEGNAGRAALVFPVSLNGAAQNTSVLLNYSTIPGTASSADGDFVATSGTLEIPVGQSGGSISVPIGGDTRPECNETFSVQLSSPQGGTLADGLGVGTILNDDAGDSVPAPFAFAPRTGAAPGSTQQSASARISGINVPAAVTVTGGSYSLNGKPYTTAPGSACANDLVRVRQVAAATPSSQAVTTLSVGGVQASFSSTTVAADTRPDAFGFTAQSNLAPSTVRESNVVRIGGINAPAAVSVSGGSYRINGGTYTTAASTLRAGDTVQVRATSSAVRGARVNAVLSVGGVSGAFSLTTAP